MKLYRTITSDEPKGFFVFTRVTVPVHYEQQIRTMSENSHTFSSVVIEIEGERHNKRADKIYSINAESLHQSIMMQIDVVVLASLFHSSYLLTNVFLFNNAQTHQGSIIHISDTVDLSKNYIQFTNQRIKTISQYQKQIIHKN